MLKMPVLLSFLSMSILGVWLAVSSSSWFGVWSGLELNLLSFLPVMMISGSSTNVEAGLKYFLIQACGSLVILQSGVMASKLNTAFASMLVLALVLKAGGAPFHFWLPMVSEGLSWFKVALLLSMQKIAPLCLLSYLVGGQLSSISSSLSLASAAVGTVGGVNEVRLRKLMAYSSISHFGWIMLAMMLETGVWAIYFLVYCSVALGAVSLFSRAQLFHLYQVGQSSTNLVSGGAIWVSLLSLGGLPPLVGFFSKWWVVLISAETGNLTLAILLSGLSVISLFYYLRLSLVMFTNSLTREEQAGFKLDYSKPSGIIMLNLSGSGLMGWLWSSSLLH